VTLSGDGAFAAIPGGFVYTADVYPFGSGVDGDLVVDGPFNMQTSTLNANRFGRSICPCPSLTSSPDAVAYRVAAAPEGTLNISVVGNIFGLAAGDRVLIINLQGCESRLVLFLFSFP
jgi:hypothetical protein